jgi:hypothetical protein
MAVITAKLSRFACSLMVGLAMGGVVGGLLDAGLWEISYDYVFPEAYAARHGTRLGLFLGALYGAATTITMRPRPSWRRLWRDAGLAAMVTVIGGGACGLAGWSLAKTGYDVGVDAGLAMPPRHAFCVWWLQGTAALAWLTTVCLVLAVWRARLTATRPAAEGGAGSTPSPT